MADEEHRPPRSRAEISSVTQNPSTKRTRAGLIPHGASFNRSIPTNHFRDASISGHDKLTYAALLSEISRGGQSMLRPKALPSIGSHHCIAWRSQQDNVWL
jgi:hypothetical protein